MSTAAGPFCGPAICNLADECLPIGAQAIQQTEDPGSSGVQTLVKCLVLDSKGCTGGKKCIALESYDGVWLQYDASGAHCVNPGNAGLFDKCKTSADCGMHLICSGGVTGGGTSGYRCLELCSLGNSGTCSYAKCSSASLKDGGFGSSTTTGVCGTRTDGNCSRPNSESDPCHTCGSWDGSCHWCAGSGKGFCAENSEDCGAYTNQTTYDDQQWTTKCP